MTLQLPASSTVMDTNSAQQGVDLALAVQPQYPSQAQLENDPFTMPAHQRAVAIQASLKEIVLQTAYALRSRAQLTKMGLAGNQSVGMPSGADEAATSLEPLGAECARYLALVRGLRDYLLHAQASLEIELEKATKREAQEAQRAAEAVETVVQEQQQQNQQDAAVLQPTLASTASDQAFTPIQPLELAATQLAPTSNLMAAALNTTDHLKALSDSSEIDTDQSISTPPLPASNLLTQEQSEVISQLTQLPPPPVAVTLTPHNPLAALSNPSVVAGSLSSNAIVIDSDGEDDLPLAFAPKKGEASTSGHVIPALAKVDASLDPSKGEASRPIDLTANDSPQIPLTSLPSVSSAPSVQTASQIQATSTAESPNRIVADDQEGDSDLFGDADQQSFMEEEAVTATGMTKENPNQKHPGDGPADPTAGAPGATTSLSGDPLSAPNNSNTTSGTGTIDLSSFGIDVSNLSSQPPSSSSLFTSTATTIGDTSGISGFDMSTLGGLMGIDLSSLTTTTSSSSASLPFLDANRRFTTSGGLDASNPPIDLSSFDFSSLSSPNATRQGGGGGQVDLSSLLQTLSAAASTATAPSSTAQQQQQPDVNPS